MSPVVTTKLIEALELTTGRINDFLETNREIFGELNPSPYGFMAFCSFLVVASYAPAKEYFPDTLVKRNEADTEGFKQIVILSITQSLLERHSGALDLIESEEKKKQQALDMKQQVTNLLNDRHAEYFGYFKKDIDRLAEEQTDSYPNLSAGFMRDVLGREEDPDTGRTEPASGNISLGLCLSTTVSGLMSFFDRPDDIAG